MRDQTTGSIKGSPQLEFLFTWPVFANFFLCWFPSFCFSHLSLFICCCQCDMKRAESPFCSCRYEGAVPSSPQPPASLRRVSAVGASVDHHLSRGRPIPGAGRSGSWSCGQGKLPWGRSPRHTQQHLQNHMKHIHTNVRRATCVLFDCESIIHLWLSLDLDGPGPGRRGHSYAQRMFQEWRMALS